MEVGVLRWGVEVGYRDVEWRWSVEVWCRDRE